MQGQQYRISTSEMKEIFGDQFDDGYPQEAAERWGDTDAWRQSAERTSHYTREDWEAIKADSDEITARFAEVMSSGAAADSTSAMDLAEAQRQQLCTHFFDCSKEMHVQIAELNVCDARYAQPYEQAATGLARFVRDAVVANAAR